MIAILATILYRGSMCKFCTNWVIKWCVGISDIPHPAVILHLKMNERS